LAPETLTLLLLKFAAIPLTSLLIIGCSEDPKAPSIENYKIALQKALDTQHSTCFVVTRSMDVYFDKERGQYIWRISAVTAEAVNRILRPVLEMPDKIYLKQKRGHIYIQKRTVLEETSYEALMAKFWSEEVEYIQAKLQCLSTTSFKVDQQYTIFPEAFRIYRYLLRQWNQFTSYEMMDSEDLLAALESAVFIRDYNLRMGMYGLEGIKIRGFRGQIVMQFKRNLVMQRILSLLTYYSQFTGLGIKTALGMGGVQSEMIV